MTQAEVRDKLARLPDRWELRSRAIRCMRDGRQYCPLSAVFGGHMGNAASQAVKHGLRGGTALIVMGAADGTSYTFRALRMREKLIRACRIKVPA